MTWKPEQPHPQWDVSVVVDLGFTEVGDGELSVTRKEELFVDSTEEDGHFMDSANGNKLGVVKTAIISM